MSSSHGGEGEWGRRRVLWVTDGGPTTGRLWKVRCRSTGGAGGMRGVAVKCVEIRRNTGGEGGLLARE